MTTDTNDGAAGHILVGLDETAGALAALRWAVEEAAATGSSLEAVNVYPEPAMAYAAPGYVAPDLERIDRYSHDLIRTVLEGIRDDTPTIKVTARAERGYPGEVLAHESDASGVTEVVVGARCHGPLSVMVTGSVVKTLSRRCQKPLVIVPSTWRPEAGPVEGADAGSGKIVVGVDGSDESFAALEWALREASLRSAPVEAVMAWAAPAPLRPAHSLLGADPGAGDSGKLRDWLDARMAAVDRRDVSLEVKIVRGRAPEVLRSEATGAQMLVVGRRHHALLHELTHGSVSRGCTRHAVLPVVVVPCGR